MRDPICNEFGNSYSRRAYEEALIEEGRKDPILKKPLKTGAVYPNVNLKKAIERFL